MTIDVYYAEVCGLCHKAMDYLSSRDLEFTAKEVIYDSVADEFVDSDITKEMYERCGEKVEFVPQIFVNGTYVGGWRKLESMIENGEFDKLLEG